MKRWTVLVLVLMLGTGIVGAQDNAVTVISPALQEQLTTIEDVTSAIRGLELNGDISRDFPTREELSEYLRVLFEEELPQDAVDEAMHFYLAFDLIEPGVDIRQAYFDLLESQIAGFYDTETEVMNVILISGDVPGDSLPLMEQIIYAHEYVHALQDATYDLDSLGINDAENSEEFPDQTLALISLIEGDATVVMNEYTILATQNNPLAAVQLLTQGFQSGGFVLPEGLPDILITELIFPYSAGADFVTALIADGGFEAVDDAFRNNLPVSTEHILHPETYFEGDMPIEVTLQPENDTLNGEWELVYERTLGEFYLRQYLMTQLERLEMNESTRGWGGDLYRLYYNPTTDQRAWTMRLEWDTTADAAEFAEVFMQFGNARYAEVATNDGACWVGDTDALCFAPQDDATAIAFAPTRDTALGLLEVAQ